MVHESVERKRLAELGYVSDLSLLSADMADAFIEISIKKNEIEAERNQRK